MFNRLLQQRGANPIADEHKQIALALTRPDAALARQAMHAHLQRVIEEFSACVFNDEDE